MDVCGMEGGKETMPSQRKANALAEERTGDEALATALGLCDTITKSSS